MYSPQDFHVSPSAWPDSERERMMTATSGRRLSELYVKPGPLGSLARTLLESSRWFSPARRLKWEAVPLCSEKVTEKEYCYGRNTSSKPYAVTLNEKVTKSGRLLFRLVPSEHPTDGTGCGLLQGGLLPTPRATEIVEDPDKFVKRNGDRKPGCMPNLSSMAAYRADLLPTPMSTEVRHGQRVKELKEAGGQTFHSRENGETRPNGLMDYMDFHGMLPTPTAMNYKGSVSFEKLKRTDGKMRTDDLKNIPVMIGQHCQQTDGATSQLNPLFVQEMMGFPYLWTELPFQSGGRNP